MISLSALQPTEDLASVRVSEAAILHNLQWLKHRVGPKKLIVMLKSDAYGHGLLEVGRLVDSQVQSIGVAALKDATALRAGGVRTEIVVMGGVHRTEDLELCSRLDISVLIHCEPQLDTFLALSLRREIPVWVKLDLGMNRLGFPPKRARAVFEALAASANVRGKLRVMGHFSNADEPQSVRNTLQRVKFDQWTRTLGVERSLSNSAAIVAEPLIEEDWARSGLLLYGISPLSQGTGRELGLRPAMTFASQLVDLRRCKRGALVSYGGNWRSPSDNYRIGVVGAGYGDGMPRQIGKETSVLIRGRRCPLIGNVCMNLFIVDLNDCPEAGIGDSVEIWGEANPVETVARTCNTIPNELLVRVHQRKFNHD